MGFEKKWTVVLTLSVLISCGPFIFREVKGERQRSEVRGQRSEVGGQKTENRQPVGETLTVVTYNVGTLNGEKPALKSIVDAIAKKGIPDLVLLQEVPDEAFALNIARSLGLSFHAFGTYSANGSGYGLAVLSSRPLVNPEMHLLKPHGHAVLAAEMRMGQKRVLVCSVHLERVRSVKKNKGEFELPWEKAFQILKIELTSQTPRSMAVEEILALLALRPSEEVIIGGDFNTVPFSKAIRAMGRHYDDALRFTADYFTGTYTMVAFPVKPRIDYIFHSAGIEVLAASVIQEGSGDHYPVWAVFSF